MRTQSQGGYGRGGRQPKPHLKVVTRLGGETAARE